jgi:glycosyltransferase involved in cell wall biosynthesis
MYPEKHRILKVAKVPVEKKRLSIIVPAYNEEAGIGSTLEDLAQQFPRAEIIVVDDGSTDSTSHVAARPGVQVIRHQSNRGYGASLRTGIAASEGRYLLFCDADGQHSAVDAANLVAHCDGFDMVVGSRDGTSHKPLLRAPGKLILQHFADFLAGHRIPDLNCGLRVVKKSILKKYLHLTPMGFSFSSTTTFAFLKSNRRIRWIPITVKKRKGVSSVRQWKHGPQTLILMLRLTVLFEPLKVFLVIAGGLFLLTLVMLAINLSQSGGTRIGNSPVALSIATLLVFLFGLLCDQVSELRRKFRE